MKQVHLETKRRSEFLDITQRIKTMIPKDLDTGICVIFVPHTTAGITINEGADPNVQHDIIDQLDQLVPWHQPFFRHSEGNSAAHIKASLMGSSVSIVIENGQINLGTWQKIFFTEFDGPRRRRIWVVFNSV
ncbi:MAG: secondary thiamine-phosphate synthase enzyme YjbQ [Candidatus Thorarchaeota archaeon]